MCVQYDSVSLILLTGYLLFWLLEVLIFVCLWFMLCILFSAHVRYFQWVNVSYKFCSSVPSIFGWAQTVMALSESVLTTIYLAAMWWWLSHWKYWPLCVGFLYTPVENVPSGVSVIMVFRSGIAPIWPGVLNVNMIALSTELMCHKNLSLCSMSCMTKVSSTYLNLTRTINESIHITVDNPIGRNNLLHIWAWVLFTTPEHKIKNQQEQQESRRPSAQHHPGVTYTKKFCQGKHFLWNIYPRKHCGE